MYSRGDVEAWDRDRAAIRRGVDNELREGADIAIRKDRDVRGLEVIAAALAAARTAGGGVAHVDAWADRAWALALDMFGEFGG